MDLAISLISREFTEKLMAQAIATVYGDSTINGTPMFMMIINDVKLRFVELQHRFKNTTANIEAVTILGRQNLIKCIQLKVSLLFSSSNKYP
ncbi:hypothetical protein FRX31_022517 [Thalictrum thalictroides]|uniref:Uncharacterized protein n=1 Tax=Thalictrum thalictroides TaxID=46969 RepID=A0A7J6VS27_THATH|nr:hypothetical protein FRX31_022517 [Thalictrum thalictroides]